MILQGTKGVIMKQLFKNLIWQFRVAFLSTDWEVINLTLPEDTMEALIKRSIETNESINQIIVEICKQYIKEHKNESKQTK
jgi:hypothetical protein